MSKYSKEKVEYAYEKIKQLLSIVSELESTFEGRHFTLDGHLLGSIGEVMSAYYYGIELYDASAPTHDGITKDGKEVQVKITQQTRIILNEKPDYLICLFLDRATGNIFEIYNGPGKGPWENASLDAKHSCRMISISKLVTLDSMVEESQRISKANDIEKYKRVVKSVQEHQTGKKVPTTTSKKQSGKTLVEGYINKNNQENRGCTGEEGSHAGQLFYLMKCLNCGFEYKSNGCDVWLRKCPHCM